MKKRRRCRAQGAATGAPPCPVRCTATPMAVTGRGDSEWGALVGHHHPQGGAHLDPTEKRKSEAATGVTGVHRHAQGGATPLAPPWVSSGTAIKIQRVGENREVTTAGIAALRAVHHLFSPETSSLGQIGRVVTTTVGAVPLPPCPVPQQLVFSR